jgi:hypothetical protein
MGVLSVPLIFVALESMVRIVLGNLNQITVSLYVNYVFLLPPL